MFEKGTVWEDPDTGAKWAVVGVKRSYEVEIVDSDDDRDDDLLETMTVPEATIQRKLDRGDLVEPVDSSEDADWEEGHACEECGKVFDTEHGLSTHKGQAHSSDAE
jgi:hypothetical protein